MKRKYYCIALLLLGYSFTIHSKIVDPSPLIYKNKVYVSHLNIVYAFDVSALTEEDIKHILNGEKTLADNSEDVLNDDSFIYLKPIWMKKVYGYIPPIIPLDQYVNFICKIEINNDVLRIENSKGSVFYLATDTGSIVSKKIVFDGRNLLTIIFLIFGSFVIILSIYRFKKIKTNSFS